MGLLFLDPALLLFVYFGGLGFQTGVSSSLQDRVVECVPYSLLPVDQSPVAVESDDLSRSHDMSDPSLSSRLQQSSQHCSIFLLVTMVWKGQRFCVEDPSRESCFAQGLNRRLEDGLFHYQYSVGIKRLDPLGQGRCSFKSGDSPLSWRQLVDRKLAGVYEKEAPRSELLERRSFITIYL